MQTFLVGMIRVKSYYEIWLLVCYMPATFNDNWPLGVGMNFAVLSHTGLYNRIYWWLYNRFYNRLYNRIFIPFIIFWLCYYILLKNPVELRLGRMVGLYQRVTKHRWKWFLLIMYLLKTVDKLFYQYRN